MDQWNATVQQMIDWIEAHLTTQPTLGEMSAKIGYSPFYLSSRFHEIVGMTLKRYIAGRRLTETALAIRDTDERILDIALRYGFSSQQALTKAFVCTFGCTPAAYRKQPRPIRFSTPKAVLFPRDYTQQGEPTMNKTILTDPAVRVEYIPAHRYLFIRDSEVQSYFDLWERHDCDHVTGIIESMSHVMHPVVTCHTAGWFWENGKRGYTYGLGVSPDYDGPLPDGFEAKDYPGSYYLSFQHPPFDFLKDCDEVLRRVETMAWSFDPARRGFRWNEEDCQDYQRMLADSVGYQVLRPVRL